MINKEKNETELFLRDQLDIGFKPKWFITYHYKHPSEYVRAIRETNRPYGYQDRIGFKTFGDMWKMGNRYENLERKRNSYDSLVKDTMQIKNVILKYLYGIKRPNQTWKYTLPPLFFFHELGKVKLQYHTHLLMPKVSPEFDNEVDLKEIFNSTIRQSRKCFSFWKDIHIRPIDNPMKALSYVIKETTMLHNSFDYESSLLIHKDNLCVV